MTNGTLSSISTAKHASITLHYISSFVEAMGKDYKLLEADELPIRQSDENSPRRAKRPNHAIVAVLLFFIATFWFTTIGPAFTIGRHSCTHKLTVEQRAARILEKHPLIG